MQSSPQQQGVDNKLFAGVDVGGTKVAIMDSASSNILRYSSQEYANVEGILDDYFARVGRRPASITIDIAGPRDDETGAAKPTNLDWPSFQPAEAAKRYPGTTFQTANDMIATAAGSLAEEGIELKELKPGTPAATGTKLIITVSTGIGAAAAVWDSQTKRYVFMASEGGHIGIQPENDDEAAYLRYLQAKHPHVSAELALSGKFGFDSLIDHTLAQQKTGELVAAIQRSRESNRPVGAVLLEFATEGTGDDKETAQKILSHIGNMLGSVVRDLVVAFKATGGVYLTGSVAMAIGEYFAQETGFLGRFVHKGAVHDAWIEKIPIYLVTDPHVAVKGALALAQSK